MKAGKGKDRKLEPARPDQSHFDLAGVAAALHDAPTLVAYGVSGVLDQYTDIQSELRHECGDY